MSKENKKTNGTSNSLAYRGDITIQLLRGKKVYKTIKTHNAGELPLFEFMANCLAGNYYPNKVPKFIRTFCYNDGMQDKETTKMLVPYSDLILEKNVDNVADPYYTVTMKFLIPFAYIMSASESNRTTNGTNKICLYSNENSEENNGNPSASFILYNEDKSDFDYILPDGKSNVLITWVMSLRNQLD